MPATPVVASAPGSKRPAKIEFCVRELVLACCCGTCDEAPWNGVTFCAAAAVPFCFFCPSSFPLFFLFFLFSFCPFSFPSFFFFFFFFFSFSSFFFFTLSIVSIELSGVRGNRGGGVKRECNERRTTRYVNPPANDNLLCVLDRGAGHLGVLNPRHDQADKQSDGKKAARCQHDCRRPRR